MPSATVDGNDAVLVFQVVSAALERARRGEGPTLIEAKTYRMTGFSTSDMGGYQSNDDLARWAKADPIENFARRFGAILGQDVLSALASQAADSVTSAFEKAYAAPLPEAADLLAPEYGEVV